jgi:hypothetical protein
MADYSRETHQSGAFRLRLLDEGDRSLASAKALVARAEVDTATPIHWNEAGECFEQAARLFRRASLGLIARRAYEQASDCYSRAGVLDAARQCSERASAIPAYWEASPNE